MQSYMKLISAAMLVTTASFAEPQSTQLPDWKLEASRDSFVINVQGNPAGFTVLAVERMSNGGFRVTEHTQIGDFTRQKTEVLLDEAHRLKKVNQCGKMRGGNARIAIEYHGKKVKGAASIPGPNGSESFVIDAAVPADVIDDNLLQSMLPLLPWSADANWKIPVFSAAKNELHETTVVVTGTEVLNTSSGAVDSYRAELRGGEIIVAIWVTKAAPHRLLKITPAGAPFEMVRVH